ncbi:hypothetical protein CSX04_05944 [Burkholderia cepacia]|nr:hypothetical protein CSX04_05944 [Burkholderia cepacia]
MNGRARPSPSVRPDSRARARGSCSTCGRAGQREGRVETGPCRVDLRERFAQPEFRRAQVGARPSRLAGRPPPLPAAARRAAPAVRPRAVVAAGRTGSRGRDGSRYAAGSGVSARPVAWRGFVRPAQGRAPTRRRPCVVTGRPRACGPHTRCSRRRARSAGSGSRSASTATRSCRSATAARLRDRRPSRRLPSARRRAARPAGPTGRFHS